MEVLHSYIQGSGPDLVILHGFMGMADNWKTLGNAYESAGYRVHLVDQRNHGKSFHHPEFNYQVLVDDLWRYLDHWGIPSTKIIGHSMGGKTAMRAACARPDRIERLLVADIGPKAYPPHHQQIMEAMIALASTPPASRQEAAQSMEKRGLAPGIVQFLLKNLARKPDQTLGWKLNLPVLYQSMENIGAPLEPQMTYPGPTLFLRGSKSTYILDTDRAQITAHFPQAEISDISGAGHWLHAENPQEFLQKSLAFLAQ